ncbi:Aspartate ammonia-lyase [Klebsiella pneumoniae]|uniref:Aspartate ammonia-lyase n=1 Tax=Klebsiella pneumoniae TaxID=573 RepID=A0A377TIP5_KLEPN|nr:Aspartate ammonia-lyase [Klebsiella pneumoniae]
MEPVIGQAMFESIHILTNACYNLLEKCVNGITANKAVCEGYVYNSIGIVTYLNPFIGPPQWRYRRQDLCRNRQERTRSGAGARTADGGGVG